MIPEIFMGWEFLGFPRDDDPETLGHPETPPRVSMIQKKTPGMTNAGTPVRRCPSR